LFLSDYRKRLKRKGEESAQWMKESIAVSKKHNITFYDSSCIAISKLFDMPLWTLDKLQGRIAVKVGATLWEE